MPKTKLKIDIGVGGKFHSEHLARSLLGQGHDVQLWSSFPKSQFSSLAADRVRSLPSAEVVYRLCRGVRAEYLGQLLKMRWFGQALARRLRQRPRSSTPDLFIGWSSFALETLKTVPFSHKAIFRDSAHIGSQMKILREEYAKLGRRFAAHGAIVERECEEYEKADTILVLSEFARQSFLEHGVPANKVEIIRLGVDTSLFFPSTVEPKFDLPLRVVYFGGLSVRKGIPYLLEATRGFAKDELELTLIGSAESAVRKLLRQFPQARVRGPMPQGALAPLLREQQVFVMPTVEDGFGQTVIQAMASGLVPIATDRCGAAETIESGKNGFVLRAGDSSAIHRCLSDLAHHPERLAAMRLAAIVTARAQTWQRYGQDVESWLKRVKPVERNFGGHSVLSAG